MEGKNKPNTLSENSKGIMSKIENGYKKMEKKCKYTEAFTFLGASLLSVSMIIAAVNVTGGETEVNIASNKAEQFFYEDNFDAAIKECDTLQSKEEWPEYTVKQAEIYSIRGEYKKSNNLLVDAVIKRNKLLKEDNNKYIDKDSKLMNDIVFTFFMNKEYKEALTLGEDYLKDNNDKEMIKNMFTGYLVEGSMDKAKEMVDKYPVDIDSSYDLAVQAQMYMTIDNLDKGFKTLKDAYYLDKDEVKVYDVITQFATINREDMLNKLEKLSKDNKDEVCYKLWMAKIYAMEKETSNLASDILKELDGKEIGQTQISIMNSQIAKNNNDVETANNIINELINYEKDSYIGYHITAWQALNFGDYDTAYELCKKSIMENENYPNNYGYLIPEILTAKGQSQNIESFFRTALSKEPYNYNMVLKIADYYLNTALNNDKAREYYNLAILLKENSAENYYNLASIDILEEKLDDAIVNLEKAIELDSSNNNYYRTLGTVYLNNNENDKSIDATRKAYSLDSKDVLSLSNAGCFYITVEKDIARGFENIKSAYEESPKDMDLDKKSELTDNYNKAKKLYEDSLKDNGSVLVTPEFTLFY